jgi:hypothetical protein
MISQRLIYFYRLMFAKVSCLLNIVKKRADNSHVFSLRKRQHEHKLYNAAHIRQFNRIVTSP